MEFSQKTRNRFRFGQVIHYEYIPRANEVTVSEIICTFVFIAALVTVVKMEPVKGSINGYIAKLVYTHILYDICNDNCKKRKQSW